MIKNILKLKMTNLNLKLNKIYYNKKIAKLYLLTNFLQEYCTHLATLIPITKFEIYKDEMIININANYLFKIMTFLKLYTNAQFKILSYITAIDYPNQIQRFTLVYDLLSLVYSVRLRIKFCIHELEEIDSITSIYNTANWHEREVFDMFGIHFKNHPDLRRILTDYGFKGHPLRKDFPITGLVELSYDDFKKRLVYTNTQLTQNFRQKI